MSATLENSQNISKEISEHQVRTGPPKTKERSAGNFPTLQSISNRAQVNLFDIFDAAQVGRQSEGSLAAAEVGFAFADELNHDARQSTYEVEIEGICA